MNKTRVWKLVAVGMVLLFAFAVFIPAIPARMEDRIMHILPRNNGFFTDHTLMDWTNDVGSFHYRNNRWTIITNSTAIEVQNIDVIQASYQQQEGQVTLSVQVAGSIENRGHWDDCRSRYPPASQRKDCRSACRSRYGVIATTSRCASLASSSRSSPGFRPGTTGPWRLAGESRASTHSGEGPARAKASSAGPAHGGRLAGKTALVTAAGQGIGRCTAEWFAREGETVWATDVNPALLEGLADCRVAALDVTDPAAIESVVARASAIDVLFNCAGYVANGTVLDCSEDDWHRSFELNVCWRAVASMSR